MAQSRQRCKTCQAEVFDGNTVCLRCSSQMELARKKDGPQSPSVEMVDTAFSMGDNIKAVCSEAGKEFRELFAKLRTYREEYRMKKIDLQEYNALISGLGEHRKALAEQTLFMRAMNDIGKTMRGSDESS